MRVESPLQRRLMLFPERISTSRKITVVLAIVPCWIIGVRSSELEPLGNPPECLNRPSLVAAGLRFGGGSGEGVDTTWQDIRQARNEQRTDRKIDPAQHEVQDE